jgi:alkanesulfonate monooxygenase SsuD/methylene tetrahydromethanopterin reductase-like flavin-dependent oxidoreductase (luciferase family)
VQIGVSLPNVGLNHGKETLLPVAEAAERLGFDSVWVAHHVALPYERDSE